MFNTIRLKTLIIAASVSFVVGLVLSSHLALTKPIGALSPNEITVSAIEPSVRSQSLPDFVGLAKRLSPTVVNISTIQVREATRDMPNPFGDDHPFSELWKKFGNPIPRGPSRERSLGSGFIISRDGYILTNHHVIENAEVVYVKLSDKREFEAEVVGSDPKTDVALLKIKVDGNLPTAPLGDSNRLQVGEWVLAIGNPFGLEHTVTSGIVSAKGRRIGAGPYDNFIQTDASINPGNSGGPLINRSGEIVGINTAIFTRGGGNIGIGFTIPINLVKEILPQLKDNGKVTRGWLGVTIQRVTSNIAESLGLADARGALVANLSRGGPAEQAGVEVGDVIVQFNGDAVRASRDLPIMVARTSVGQKVEVKALRDGKQVTLTVKIGKLQDEPVLASAKEQGALGLTVQKVTPQMAARLGREDTQGVFVTAVEAGSLAHGGGLQRGDVILEVDRKPVNKLKDFLDATADSEKGKSTLLLVWRDGNTLFFAFKNYG